MAQIFYRMQMKAGAKGETITDTLLADNKITSHIDFAGQIFDDLIPGTIILVHKGSIPVALVVVKSKVAENDLHDKSFGVDYNIEIISSFNKDNKKFKVLNDLYQKIPHLGTFAKIEENNATYNRVLKWYTLIVNDKKMQQKLDILKYKNQIILQGPPGTGKTRLAKQIARELTKSDIKLSPAEYIEWYIKHFKTSKKSKELNAFRSDLLTEFQNEFPLETIKQITLEQYCLGKGSTNSFCYWIERGLKDLGRFSPGPAGTTVYGVYYSQDANNYISTSKTPEDLLKDIQIALALLIEKEDYSEARKLFRFSFILKILSSYYPEKYFPVVSQNHLNSLAKIWNINSVGLDDVELNKKINELFYALKMKHSSEITNFNLMGHLYDKFKIKENQFDEVLIDVVDELGETKLIQFHPAYSYEDFVRGIIVETNQINQVEYKVVNKILADFAHKALENSTVNYVLIIDEINRANLPSVLGELIYALEYRYNEDIKNEKEATVESMYALKQNEKDIQGDNRLMLPTNLFIIGTMNTADRSVGHIDYAIRRRFAFVDVLPEIEPVHPLVKDTFIKISSLFIKEYQGIINTASIEKAKTLASDFCAEDVWLGHSYFICKNEDGSDKDNAQAEPILKMKMKYEVIPILKEYIKDGILLDNDEVRLVMTELISEYGM